MVAGRITGPLRIPRPRAEPLEAQGGEQPLRSGVAVGDDRTDLVVAGGPEALQRGQDRTAAVPLAFPGAGGRNRIDVRPSVDRDDGGGSCPPTAIRASGEPLIRG